MSAEFCKSISDYIAKVFPGEHPAKLEIEMSDDGCRIKQMNIVASGKSKIKVSSSQAIEKIFSSLEATDTVPPATPLPTESNSFRYGPDYRSVSVGNKVYSFTPGQAAIISYLHEAQINGAKEVSAARILEDLGSTNKRLSNLFKRHPAWMTFIVPGSTRGTYRLKIPE